MKYIFLMFIVFSQAVYAASNVELVKIVKHFDAQWNDNNITTGTTRIEISSTANSNIRLVEKELLNQFIKKIQKKSPGTGKLTSLKVSSAKFKPQDVVILSYGYAMGNAFSPKNTEGVKYAMASVYTILGKLSADNNKDIITTSVTATYKEDDGVRKVILTAMINENTGKQVQFFIIQGTI